MLSLNLTYLGAPLVCRRMALLTAVILEDEKPLATFELKARSFIAGAGGYNAKGKVDINGKKYSLTLSLIEVD